MSDKIREVAEHEEWIEEFRIIKTKPTTLEAQLKEFGTKSALIRYLHSEGWSRGAIAKHMDIRYQHVRNVLLNPPKKS